MKADIRAANDVNGLAVMMLAIADIRAANWGVGALLDSIGSGQWGCWRIGTCAFFL